MKLNGFQSYPRFYLVCLLRTSLESPGGPEVSLFNSSFVNLWRKTKNYQFFRGDAKLCQSLIDLLPPGHPFSGHLSMDDMKLHLSNTISNTEGGKKVTAVVSNTGRAVAGGFSSAKGAISSFLTSLRQDKSEPAASTAAPPVVHEEEDNKGDETKSETSVT